MRPIPLMILIAGIAAAPALAAGPTSASPAPPGSQLTGKERLSDKGSDEQRVDDCKVPPARRTRARPTACPWNASS